MLIPKKNEVRKPTRTISGVTPLAVMLPPKKCKHGACLYCPNLGVPQSYTPKSPVVMRARDVGYDSYEQVKARLKAFEIMNHPTEKIEIIIMGGTFLEYPKKFQYEFVKGIYDGLNGRKSPRDDSGEPSKNLLEAQKKNEKAKHRCIALCIETRPDKLNINQMREFGCTRVELGVQIIDDKIYKKIKRGHTVKDVVGATEKLKNAGFKVGYHIMPGLPGSNLKKDLKLFKKLFSDERFKPDQLKLYPCQVIPGSELEKLYWKGKYKPYAKQDIEKILIEMLKAVPRYCRVMRVMREIPPEYITAGTIHIDLRKNIEKEFRNKDTQGRTLKNILLNIFTRGNFKIKEIRYREIGFALQRGKDINSDLKLKITKYKASKGTEYFLEVVNKDDILFGLVRLRIYKNKTREPTRHWIKCVSCEHRSAIIRELHVYGKSLKLGQKNVSDPQKGTPRVLGETNTLQGAQHTGIGKWLMSEAEKIVCEEKIGRLKVISGIGVKEYYKKLGYNLEGTYMVKIL